jgi:L,D-transpeptidase catalytic domain
MRNFVVPVSLLSLFVLLAAFTGSPAISLTTTSYHSSIVLRDSVINTEIPADNKPSYLYTSLNLEEKGLSKEAFNYAWKGYQRLLEKKLISRSDYLTICDFSQPSSQKRLYIIDVTSIKLVVNTYVAHGRNSGGEYATQFSNKPESLESSLGFYITQSTYIGEHGLSLRINGVDAGFNDKAYQRSIVIHGAAYVDESRARQGVFMGRSFGCPAVPQKESANIITTIKNGTCLFIYHPDKNYLLGSKILNG